ncbi:MAG: hypothetical protein ACSHX7_07350 [Luteolibacter sp.]
MLGLLLFVVGMLRVDGVMAVLGVSVGVLFFMAWLLGRENLKGLGLEYRGMRRVEAGRGFPVRLALVNERGLLDGFRVEFGMLVSGEREISGKTTWLEVGGRAEISQRVSLTKRGMHTDHEGWVESVFPLGLLSFRKKLRVLGETGVLPRVTVPRELNLSGFLLDGFPLGVSRHHGEIGEWKGLREWRGGDAVRRIAWAASARSQAGGGGLLVREDEPPGAQAEGCLVVFHSYGGDGSLIRPDRFENALALLNGVLGSLQGWGMSARVMADFHGWEKMEVRTRRDLGAVRERLMQAARAGWTEAHDLGVALSGAGERECVVVISDMPLALWEGKVPKMPLRPVLVDIGKYDKRSRSESTSVRGSGR